MSTDTAVDRILLLAKTALRERDSHAFAVPARIVRRIISQEFDLPGLRIHVPHRKSFVLSKSRLLRLVSPDEVGIESADQLPDPIILIAEPEDDELIQMTSEQLRVMYWRLLFHCRVHIALEQLRVRGKLPTSEIRQWIDRIGQIEFDEVRAVLRQETFLLPHAELYDVFVEFAAVGLELYYFLPDRFSTYFPAIDDPERVIGTLNELIDAKRLYEETKLNGVSAPVVDAGTKDAPTTASEIVQSLVSERRKSGRVAARRFRKLIRRADRASSRGNNVRAAVLRIRAAGYAAADFSSETALSALAELETLTARMRKALLFDEQEAVQWQRILTGLLRNSVRGFWGSDLRLLYDLQKVCVDHEREIYVVDLPGFLRSFGKKPLKRPLPNQRLVLMSKHLRSAARRLPSVQLTGAERKQLSALLHRAAQSAERQMRETLRPMISGLLDDVGFVAQNLPERVSRKKIVEELLDNVVKRGFLTMGDLRDAISRSNVKLPDLSGPRELWEGDRLLRSDRKLAAQLDGVYRRGAFYLRWLQGFCSLAFGTKSGRWITQYLAIPFGGSFLILEGLNHLIHPVMHLLTGQDVSLFHETIEQIDENTEVRRHFVGTEWPILQNWSYIILLGVFLLGLIHVGWFRRGVFRVLTSLWQVGSGLVIQLPRRLMSLRVVRNLLRSPAYQFFRSFLLVPLIITVLFWFALPELNLYERFSWPWGVALFFGLCLGVNSRIGRNLEEVTTERVERAWRLIRVRFFVALFEAVVDFFKWTLEQVERVMYEVDEWLRFKSGESRVALWLKGILGIFWSAAAGVFRFLITVLVEPQINPIKHFPVVTVSHKLLLPLIPHLSRLVGAAVAVPLITAVPGVFGFLVWEFKENWKLYSANRRKKLAPVTVGDHGETFVRLLKPGFHSGTIPKLYAKLRRASRDLDPERRAARMNRYRENLHHNEQAIQRLIERELIALLVETPTWSPYHLAVGHVEVGTNSVRIELTRPEYPAESLWLAFGEQSGWLIVGVSKPGWLVRTSREQRRVLESALAGLYKSTGVDLVREQFVACFAPKLAPYDVTERGLIIWPGSNFDLEVFYNLRSRPLISPRPRMIATEWRLPTVEAERLIFQLSEVSWERWTQVWSDGQISGPEERLIPDRSRLLPLGPNGW